MINDRQASDRRKKVKLRKSQRRTPLTILQVSLTSTAFPSRLRSVHLKEHALNYKGVQQNSKQNLQSLR